MKTPPRTRGSWSALLVPALVLSCLLQGAPHRAQSTRQAPAQVGDTPPPAPVLAPHRPGEVLLRFTDSASAADRTAILAGLGAATMKRLGAGSGGLVQLQGLTVQQALDAYGRHPRLAYIEPNYIISAQVTPDDPSFPLQWGMFNGGQSGGTVRADIRAREAWDVFTGSADVLVAVLDSGIDFTHPDLLPNIYVNPGEVAGNGVDDDGNGFVDDTRGWNFVERNNDATDVGGHGTHVSGILGAVGDNAVGVAGTSWTVKLLPVRFLNAGGFGATAQAVESIDYAIAMNARIINASWGNVGFTISLREAIARARDAGIVFVAASGNAIPALNLDVAPFYPASYDLENIIAVAASDHDDVIWRFSNFGRHAVDLAAPGVAIFSTEPGGYGYRNGTSMAAPHVSGALALLFGRFPGLSALDARALLLERADALPTLDGVVAGGRRLNALGPIAIADDVPPAPIDTLAVAEIDGGRADLQWIATGDDGQDGQANRYDVRFSSSAIDESSFAAATRVIEVAEPSPAGTVERVRIQGLQFDTLYHFAVKALDELGNSSAISNVVSARTLTPPVVVAEPLVLTDTLAAGEGSEHIVRIENDGEAEYIFDVIIRRPQSGAAGLRAFVEQPARSWDAAATDGIVLPSAPAGPSVSAAPRGVGGAGEDLRILFLGGGTDAQDIRTELAGFPDIAQLDLFDATSFTPLLSDLLPYQVVVVMVNLAFTNRGGIGDVLADYVDAGGGVVLTQASFVAGWQIDGRFRDEGYYPLELGTVSSISSDLGAFDDTHPIMLGVSEAVGHQLAHVVPASGAELVAEWTSGQPFVVTKDRVVGLNVSVLDNDLWSGDVPLVLANAAFWASGAVSWLYAEPEGGIVGPGEQLDLRVTFDAVHLIAGDYEAEVALRGNDPERPDLAVAVGLVVTGAPDIEVAPGPVDFGATFVGTSVEVQTVVSNSGTDTLTVSAVGSDRADFAVDPAGFALEPRQSRALSIHFAPGAPGAIQGTLTFESDDPDTPRAEVELIGQGLGPPRIEVTPGELAGALDVGQSQALALRIDNPGASDMEYELHLERAEATFTFEENFEDGDLDGWVNAGTSTGAVTSAVAAAGSRYSYHESFAPFGHLNGIYRLLGAAQPGYAGVYIRPGAIDRHDSFFVLRDNQGRDVIWFYAQSVGTFYVNADVGGHETFPYQAETWYHVEFKNIDYQLKRFDYYVDGVLIQAEVPFRTPANHVDRLDLYGFHTGARSWWDEIFISSNGPVETVRLDRAFDTVPAGGSVLLPVTLDATRVVGGEYRTRLVIDSNDPATPRVVVPIVVSVTGFPRIELTPAGLDFGTTLVGLETTRSVRVANAGSDALMVEQVVTDHPDFVVDPSGFVVEAGGRLDLSVTFRPSAPGAAAATLEFASNDAAQPVSGVSLVGSGLLAPRVELTPDDIRETLFAGQAATHPVTVTNVGGEPLSFQVTLEETGGGPIPIARNAFADDGEPGAPGWTTEVYGGQDLWHRTTTASNSPDTAWWCGIEGQGGYDNGARVGNALISPPIDLRGLQAPAVLQFAENYQTEPGYDSCLVDLSVDGGRSWIPLRGRYGSAPSGSSAGWRLESLSLTPYIGRIVRVRFYFETQDGVNNQGAGWFVDDVRVRGGIEPWLLATGGTGTLSSGQSAEIELTLAAPALGPASRYEGRVNVRSNDILTPEVHVPVALDVAGSPRIALAAFALTLDSAVDLDGGIVSHHRVLLDPAPGGAGEVRLEATGDFGGPARSATLSAEAAVIGVVGESGAGCGTVVESFALAGGLLHALAADGSIDLEVRNSAAVGADCPVNRHALRLTYRPALVLLNLGAVPSGEVVTRSVTVANTGDGLLEIASVAGDLPGLVVQPASLQVPPGGSAEVEVRFSAGPAGAVAGNLRWVSNDRARPTLDLPFVAEVRSVAVATVAPGQIVATLPPRTTRTRTKPVRLANVGSAALDWSAAAPEHAIVEPAAGSVAPGGHVDLNVTFGAADLEQGDYASTLTIQANTAEGSLDVPLLLRVREVELDRLNVEFSPRFATSGDTVEVALELPLPYAPDEILVDSILLNDCAVPAPAPASLADLDLDGVMELIVQFESEAFEECMPRDGADGIRSVTVVGEVEDRTWFTGTRYLRGVVQLP